MREDLEVLILSKEFTDLGNFFEIQFSLKEWKVS